MAVSKIIDFEDGIYPFIEAKYPDLFEQIRTKKALDKDLEDKLAKAIEDFKENHI